jgi:hypothetical protein
MKTIYKLYLRPPENMAKLLIRLLPIEKIIELNSNFILTINEKPINKSAFFKDFESYQKYKKESVSRFEKIETQTYENGSLSIRHGQNL